MRTKLLVVLLWFTCLDPCRSFDSDPCSSSPDPGQCDSQLLRYFYDREHGRCRQFIYSGCHGNQNNFLTEEDCLSLCEQSGSFSAHTQIKDKISDFLVLDSTSKVNVFTFSKPSSYIAVTQNELHLFSPREAPEISFEFRTTRSEGLLFYLNLRREQAEFELHVLLEAGRLKSTLAADFKETSTYIGAGLGDDQWHSVQLHVNTQLRRLRIILDKEAAKTPATLTREDDGKLGYEDDIDNSPDSLIIFIGGVNKTSDEWLHPKDQFYGCIRNIQLQPGRSQSQSLLASQYEHVQEGCIDRCATRENECRSGARCLNHYQGTTCDCYGTSHEGDTCDYDDPAVLTMDGFSHISYHLENWSEGSCTKLGRLSFLFRTDAAGSSLLYGSGSSDHIGVSLLPNGSLYLDLRVKEVHHFAVIGEQLNNGLWHNFTLTNNGSRVLVILDGRQTKILFDGDSYPQIDPFFYIGGGRTPINHNPSFNNKFVGCLKEVYVNDVSVLYKLRVNASGATFHGDKAPKFGDCPAPPEMPMTFLLEESRLLLDVPEQLPLLRFPFELSFSLRTKDPAAVLVSAKSRFVDDTVGLWELRLTRSSLEMRVYLDFNSGTYASVLEEEATLHDGSWHQIRFKYNQEEVVMAVDQQAARSVTLRRTLAKPFQVADRITFGASLINASSSFRGCVKDIIINRIKQDPRKISRRALNATAVLFNGCYLTEDPCGEANLCLHNGTCLLNSKNGVTCDCTGTGYIGSRCQFAVNRKRCEEVAMPGNKDGLYLLDIDGNGPHPPARAWCQLDAETGVWKTLVHHNFPPETVIRSNSHENLVYSISYHEFSAAMLQFLISHSVQCRQYVKYGCYQAPLDLHSYTWFQSSSGLYLDSIGEVPPGECPCASNSTCAESSSNLYCNCDARQDRWTSDQGLLTRPGHLAISRIFALQQRNLENTSEGRLTVGPLECVQASTQMYVTTFQTADSFLQVPGWFEGVLSFSFRTFRWPALLVDHPSRGRRKDYLRVMLENEYEMSLTFRVNEEQRVFTLRSNRTLCSGEWQHISLDISEGEVRFTVNQQYLLIEVGQDHHFGPFGPSLFIGGSSWEHPEEGSSSTPPGLIGCLRGLMINDRVVNTHVLIPRRFSSAVHKECHLSCDPNPCHNGATCVESWGSYKCLCANPYAHVGRHCQQDTNLNSVTFHHHETFLEAGGVSLSQGDFEGILTKDLTLSLRTADTNSLIVLYAYDHLNNFVGIYLEDSQLVFQFNSAGTIHSLWANISESSEHIQIFIDREPQSTRLVVNGMATSVDVPWKLLDRYHRRPWLNRSKEFVRPPRPVQRPEDFYQVFMGGVDREYIRTPLKGFTGCLRGFRIGDRLIDLPAWSKSDSLRGVAGITEGCNYLCDSKPCQNGGSCVDNLTEKSYMCNCQLTSYAGQNCTEEVAFSFQGDTYRTAELPEVEEFRQLHVDLAWSTTHPAKENQILVLISSSTQSYFSAILQPSGFLLVEETRGVPFISYGREMNQTNFVDGARHSLHYRRNRNTSILLVDRKEYVLDTQPLSFLGDTLEKVAASRVFLGGSELPAFDVKIRVDDVDYEDFTLRNKGAPVAEDQEEEIPAARCAAFPHGVMEAPESGSDPASTLLPETWTLTPVSVTKYVPVFETTTSEFDSTNWSRILLALGCVFAVCILILASYLRKLHRRSQKRHGRDTSHLLDRLEGSSTPVSSDFSAPVRSVGVTASPTTAKASVQLVERSSGLGLPATPARALIKDLIRYVDCDDPKYRHLENCYTPNDEPPRQMDVLSLYSRSPSPLKEDLAEAEDNLPEEPVFLYSVNRAPVCRISEIYLTEDDEERRLPIPDEKFLTYTADYTF